MKIQILGAHNCESQNTKLVSLLIDSSLAVDAGFSQRKCPELQAAIFRQD